MRSNIFFISGFISLLVFLSDEAPHVKARPNYIMESRWSGQLTLEERFEGLTGNSNRTVTVRFNNVLPTLYRDGPAQVDPDSVLYGQQDSTDYYSDFTDDKGTGNVIYHSEAYIGGKKIGVTDCNGGGKSQLNEVVIDVSENTYRIHAIGPACNGINTDMLTGKTESYGPEFTDIIVSDEQLTSKNLLAGSKSEDIDLGGDLGKVTRTITWHLSRDDNDVELIVIPENYHDWMPMPGINELTKGNTIKIKLKIVSINGRPPTIKARSFELKLSNTSNEPGIVLNAPLEPISSFPDLQFLPQRNTAVADQFQTADIRPANGISDSITIASFDGGGYTTLTAKAILEDNTEIEGHLLISGGNTVIPIPKRAANSNIAIAWWNAHNNPADTYDDETSAGNNNNGDGLTAYEEYRGVISRGRHKRLDPGEKEVGVWMKPGENLFFREGLTWFENATGMKVIQFSENEIGVDRRLNKNFETAHSHDQYALKLTKRNLQRGVYGRAQGGPGIPRVVRNVYIDLDQITQWQRYIALEAARQNIATPYTINQLVAKTVAHELGHGVNIPHHGNHGIGFLDRWVEEGDVSIRIFSPRNAGEITTRRYYLLGSVSDVGGQLSGDVFCMMNYYPTIDYSMKILPDLTLFYMVPRIQLGTSFCNSSAGTDFNATLYYFGDADDGNCLSRIKLK